MLYESTLILLGLGLLVAVIFYLHHLQSKTLLFHVEGLKESVSEPSMLNLEEMKEEMLDMVHDTIRNLQPPNAFDHLLGAIAPAIQSWALRKAGINPATGQPISEMLEEHIENITN